MDDFFFLAEVFLSTSDTDSPFVGASDISPESAYTGKLKELPTGTSQWSSSILTKQRNPTGTSQRSSSLCMKQRKYTN
jgi:hypothetical protein